MPSELSLLVGESLRTVDDRYRVGLPPEMAEQIAGEKGECLLAKERPGCISLWNLKQWRKNLDQGVELVQSKIQAGRLEGRVADVQALGRLLSTRHRTVQLAGRGRLVIPEGFREFLGVEPGENVMVVGAAICVELWQPTAWAKCIGEEMPGFRQLFDELAG